MAKHPLSRRVPRPRINFPLDEKTRPANYWSWLIC